MQVGECLEGGDGYCDNNECYFLKVVEDGGWRAARVRAREER